MSRSVGRCVGRLGLLAGLVLPSVLPAQQASDWDAMTPRGKTRVIDFTVDEGTWMSVDISRDSQWLVFDLLGHIYRMPITGGDAENLTANSGIALNFHPRISPDGREIAFVSDRGGQDALWVMHADGSAPRQLFRDDNSRAAEPAWTPDGQHILISRKMKSPAGFYRTNDEIWQYPRAGGEGKLVIKLAASQSSVPARAGYWVGQDRLQWPSPSPEGKYVYFHSSLFSGADRRLRRIELASGRVDDLTEPKDRYLTCCGRTSYPARLGEIAPEVSPDGKWLAFARKIPGARTSYRGHDYMGRTALWLRDLATGADKVVMDPISNDAMDLHPAWDHKVLPGYSWAADSKSLLISQGGKIRRVWIENGRVETIPFRARVHRVISEMARSKVTIRDDAFQPKFIRWPASSPDGRRLVFEAAGSLWIREGSGPVRALLATPEGFGLTPTWSPDGSTIAFTNWTDEGGHLWRMRPGTKPDRLSTAPGRYLYPVFSPDGRSVLVNRWSAALNYVPEGNGWELWSFPAAGGEPTLVRGAGRLSYGAADTSGYEYAVTGNTLVARRRATQAFWVHPAVAGSYALVKPSPDGRWLAIQQKQDVYLAPVPRLGAGDSLVLDLSPTGPGLRRLTTEGGEFARWRNGTIVEMASANQLISYDASRGRSDTSVIAFDIPREGARGSVALIGARIITLDNRRVIDQGTIVVRDGRIACVGTCDTTGVDRRINVAGKTITPGWVDVHAHHTAIETDGIIPEHRSQSARYLAWGVTTTHDPASQPNPGFALSEMIEAGKLAGPRTYSTGVPLTCSDFDDFREIVTLEDALEHLRRAANLGAISIKDYRQCTRTQRQMVSEAARRVGITVTSEGSDPLYILGLIMNGSTGWEHPIQYHPLYADFTTFFGQANAHYSAQLFISDYPHGDAIDHWLGQEDLWRNDKVRDWSPWQALALRRGLTAKPPEEFIFPILAEGAADIKRKGGYTPVGAHGEQDGLGSHWETWSYAAALTPMEALEAASLDGAHFLGLESEIGSITVGKRADLVILDSNPLENIRRTVDIRYVMKSGRLRDARTLDEIWPLARPYGRHPWKLEEMDRLDTRPDDYWNRRPVP